MTMKFDQSADGSQSHATNSRRMFVRRSFLAGVVAAPLATLGSASKSRGAEPDFPTDPAPFQSLFRQIKVHENDHVDFLVNFLGTDARPKPVFKNLEQANFVAFAELARVLENTGVAAYAGAGPAIFSRKVAGAATKIALIEARHAGVLNYLDMAPVTANVQAPTVDEPFDLALSAAEIVKLASPFVSNLNGGPELTYSGTRSAANDIAIGNFALALEYLEAEFYNINVPKFYGP